MELLNKKSPLNETDININDKNQSYEKKTDNRSKVKKQLLFFLKYIQYY